MDSDQLQHLYPTLEILADDLTRLGLPARAEGQAAAKPFRAARRFRAGAEIAGDILYVVDPGDAPAFPGANGCCASPVAVRCASGTLLCQGASPARILDALLECFARYQRMEALLDELVYRNASLQELTQAGAELLDNPICLHDDWFVMIAKSAELDQVIPPEYVMSSSKEFIPRIIIDDFGNDSDYLETYSHRTAQLWLSSPALPACLYVNLWEGSAYRGRLLVVRHHRDFRPLDTLVAELLAQRALSLLGRKRLGLDRPHRGMDDILYDLLNGRAVDAKEEARLLDTLGWKPRDRMLCLRVRSQQQNLGTIAAHALHSDLFQVYPKGYIMLTEGQQLVVLNLTREQTTLAMVRHRLSPLCRDYCLYAGISSPVTGLHELNLAWRQAGIALDRAFQLRSERWVIPFSDCALDYLLGRPQGDMPLSRLVAPELLQLMEHDARHGTPYFDTLKAYLLQERDIPRASAALIIHRTTLLYRLKKIQSLASFDLEDPWKRLYLLLSLRILEEARDA